MNQRIKFFIVLFLFSVKCMVAQSTDVWDFGASQLNTTTYNNLLSETIINSWYPQGTVAGTAGLNMPISFTAGALSWVGNSGDRLRTTNTNLSRYDANVASVSAYTGRVYCNGTPAITAGVPTNRFLQLALNEDDEVTVVCRTDAAGTMNFVYSNSPSTQSDNLSVTFASGAVTEANFVAKNAGNYKIYSADGKASFYRITRKQAVYTAVSGNIDLSQSAGIPSNYAIVFTNAAGKSWTAIMNSNGTYLANLPIGYSYSISLLNANGFVVSNGTSLNLGSVTTPTYAHDVSILHVSLYTVSGSINGLSTAVSNLSLSYVPDPSSNSVYVPQPQINAANSTYSVELEANVLYSIVASGVNDYQLTTTSITIPAAATSASLDFSLKPVYPVTISPTGLTTTQATSLVLTFTNLNEPNYTYTFPYGSSMQLRNGTYAITASGLDNYPVSLALTSNLVVNNAAASKVISFQPVTIWSFEDKVITASTPSYKGLLFTGNVYNAISQGHLVGQAASTVKIPVNPGDKITVTYYYAANFTIDGGASITTINSTGSTSITDKVEYTYPGTSAGFITLTMNSISYFPEIKLGGSIPYSSIITVGIGKDYLTINEALSAISTMIRSSTDRVTVMIDPGNYEEMLVINDPSITLKNASPTPSTALLNKGLTIDPNAVRITSYYGHGYNYYSMAADQKWHQDVLNVNIENGYPSNQNNGSGTNNSYWNATVVVGANDFIVDGIILENSFNQYISTKESQDVVVAWSTGSPGVRPTDAGNLAVQNKTYVERAAAIAIKNNVQRVILNKCRVVGRQDSFFGGTGARVAVYKGDMMGAVDYIFGGMDAVFYASKLCMNISDASNDTSYLTAAQQASGRGFLFYNCTVTSAQPNIETASTYRAKPGYFGRPWLANTSEVVFYNTVIETSNAPGYVGQSLIQPLGWLNTLGGTSPFMYEYGTVENSGVNNGPQRASWATQLSTPVLTDGTPITTFNFTKGTDNWDPFPNLIANDALGVSPVEGNQVAVYSYLSTLYINNVHALTEVVIYAADGRMVQKQEISSDTKVNLKPGLWFVKIQNQQGEKTSKIITH
jgi:exo-poly-alpha-galacturonosidase